MKIIAYYLPQYHEIPENNKWWGEGFTEWVNVKKAESLFDGHYQPRVPQNNNYYDLSDRNAIRWQIDLAKENGLYGFCFYHYWFGGKLLLEKPGENFLQDETLDIPFCMCWANESWTNGWANASASVIMEQNYGNKAEWKEHFDYLMPFFKDDRYIKIDDKPLMVIYRPYLFDRMVDMLDYWDKLAKENGLMGISFASQRFEENKQNHNSYDRMDYHIDYQPLDDSRSISKALRLSKSKIIGKAVHDFLLKHLNVDLSFHQKVGGPIKLDYEEVWETIINMKPKDVKAIPGAFVDWDNTPRHGRRGSVYSNSSPELFEKYIKKQILHARNEYNNEYLFVFAWNEWGEGGYLEPDEKYGDAYLKAIKNALEATNEVQR
jgi:hypothetical protein